MLEFAKHSWKGVVLNGYCFVTCIALIKLTTLIEGDESIFSYGVIMTCINTSISKISACKIVSLYT